MTQIPENQIHHLQESLEEDSIRKNIPWFLLTGLMLLILIGSVAYVYNYRNLPKCQDESVQILLNKNIRSNEALIQNARTQAFEQIREDSHNDSQRSCSATLITTQGNYAISYSVVNELVEQNWLSRFTAPTQYTVVVQKLGLIQ